MAPLAAWFAARGFAVTGSDRSASSNLDWLVSMGVEVQRGHDAAHLGDAQLVIRSSAVNPENPEIVEARRRGILVVRRAEALGEVTRSGHALCVCGTHGKTTTTLMLGRILRAAGLAPAILPGGVPAALEDSPEWDAQGSLVIESDEFDRSFLAFFPDAALVTNVEADHLDCYADEEDIRDAFRQFLGKLPFHGYAVVCGDDDGARAVADGCLREVFTYGFGPDCRYRGTETPDGAVEVHLDGAFLCRFSLVLPGRHNRLNALGAIALAHREGVDPLLAALALKHFRGVLRRLQLLGEHGGVRVYDDYAHHPTEVAATLQALREISGGAPVRIAFQPHLYSRTRDFAQGFALALAQADRAVLAPVYPARETPDMGAPASAILSHAPAGSHLELARDEEDLMARMAQDLPAGTVVLFAGAGSVGSWGAAFLSRLQGASA
jgi:UDP-N-acetylmuramate--alanine ligase